MKKIKIFIVDDSKEICDYFCSIIRKEEDMEVTGVAYSGEETLKKIEIQQPDVILMDIQMESRTAGIDTALKIREKYPQIKIIILTIHKEDELLFQAYNAGVMDYIVKGHPSDQILNSIRNVYENKLMLRPDVAKKIVDEYNKLREQKEKLLYALTILTKLTNSEFEVLKSIYEGNTYRNIAKSRFVSYTTVKSQVNSILKKFDMARMKDVVELLHEIDFYEIIKSF